MAGDIAARPPFLFVRHGQTEYNVRGILAGSSDVALTATGVAEAAAAAELLAGQPLRHICSSPLKRARETARLIAGPHRLAVTIIEDLRERDWGEWEGRAFPADLGHPHPPGGEEMGLYLARVAGALEHFFALGGDGPALIVAHGGIFHALCRLLEVSGAAPGVIGNAQPVRFAPPAADGGWTVGPV
jgi:probable phosphoglycerate mutase